MIKFFRKIRQNLLSKGKTGKYFKYAIGEIVLVVIGILIALQINNWNEKQKGIVLELDILKEVRNGLETDLKDANYNLETHKTRLKGQLMLINWLEGNKDFPDSLSKYLSIIHYGTYFQSNESPYQTLKQLGLRTINNDSLRIQITKLYDLNYQQYNKWNGEYEGVTDRLVTEAANYFNEIDWFGDQMRPIDIAELRQNKKYLFYLKSATRFNEILVNQAIPSIINNINKTSAMIDLEIENRN